MNEKMRGKLIFWFYLDLAEVGMHIPYLAEEETPSCKVAHGVGHRFDLLRDLRLEEADMQRKEADRHRAVEGWHTRSR